MMLGDFVSVMLLLSGSENMKHGVEHKMKMEISKIQRYKWNEENDTNKNSRPKPTRDLSFGIIPIKVTGLFR